MQRLSGTSNSGSLLLVDTALPTKRCWPPGVTEWCAKFSNSFTIQLAAAYIGSLRAARLTLSTRRITESVF